MKKTTVVMNLLRSTKNTHLYQNNEDGSALTSIYIKKDSLPSVPPPSIEITLEEYNDENRE